MLRALTVTASTLIGVTGVMLYEPPNDLAALAVTPTKTESATSSNSPTSPVSTPSPSAPASLPPDESIQGDSFNVYYSGGRQSGTLKVELVISGGVIKEIKWLEYPTGPHMRYTQRAYQVSAAPLIGMSINDLKNANVVTKSGATGTSTAFVQSLESALQNI
jgi:uncharacterized protein with FMN-binding domain